MKTVCDECGRAWGGLRAAHCSQCHLTFTTPNAFDRHQFFNAKLGITACQHPSSVGLVYVEWRDAYRFMTPGEEEDSMVCDPCKNDKHGKCKGCTCQHRPAERPSQVIAPAGIESDESMGALGGH